MEKFNQGYPAAWKNDYVDSSHTSKKPASSQVENAPWRAARHQQKIILQFAQFTPNKDSSR